MGYKGEILLYEVTVAGEHWNEMDLFMVLMYLGRVHLSVTMYT